MLPLKKISISVCLSIGLLAVTTFCQAALQLNRSRIIFEESQKVYVLRVTNPTEDKVYLSQSWVENQDQQKITTPFKITPYIQRLDPKSKASLILQLQPGYQKILPADRESAFSLVVNEIPTKAQGVNSLNINVRSAIRIIYRPIEVEKLFNTKYKTRSIVDSLVLHKQGQGFLVDNPTPFYLTLNSIEIPNQQNQMQLIQNFGLAKLIAPYSSSMIKTTSVLADVKKVRVSIINDFGGTVAEVANCGGTQCLF